MSDEILNKTPMYTATHVFSTDDITGTFDGLTQGDVLPGETPVIDFTADPKATKEGVNLYPINSDFGFNVTDFDGAIQKDFVLDPEYAEGWAGDLTGPAGEQLGLVVSNAETDTFKTPATLGTWLAGIGGSTVKASTEHYSVMQHILSDQRYPGDPEASYPLDDNLRMIGGEYDGQYVADILPTIDDQNGDGVVDIKDLLLPNESSITQDIAAGDDYSVTMKDDGKLLYRWGNAVKRPNDVRIEAELPLPDEWSAEDSNGLIPLYKVTMAELAIKHTITNNPNDQVRPEDFENEAAIGQLPTYEILPDGKWVTTDDYYAGDGTLYPAGTVLKDPALAQIVEGSLVDQIGTMSEDLREGFTNAWYTTMDREPFEAVLNADGTDYEGGPRWRLQPNKYGQDLPSVVIPQDPSLPPPTTQSQQKYEVGEDTQTVLNLLDWEFPISPLSISAGWQNNSGSVSENGLNMTENFDVAFYIKGDIKPATIYDTQLLMNYEAITIHDEDVAISGGEGSDHLVGQGGNSFVGGAGEDLFVLNYGVSNNFSDLKSNTISDFEDGTDVLGLFDQSVNDVNFDKLITQSVETDGLRISLSGFEIAMLAGQTEALGLEDFLLVNRNLDKGIIGTPGDDYLVGDEMNNRIYGYEGDDTLLGLGGNDVLIGGEGADILDGGTGVDAAHYTTSAAAVTVNLETGVATGGEAEGDTLIAIENLVGSGFDDVLTGDDAANRLSGGAGDDTLDGGAGNDQLIGGAGADTLIGGDGTDKAIYSDSAARVSVNLASGLAVGGDAVGDVLTGIESLVGSDFDDKLVGDAGSNFLTGGNGNDTLGGGAGNDVLYGDNGADTLVGGGGFDTANYARSNAAVSVNLETGVASGGFAEGDTLDRVEAITGSDFFDTLVGDALNNRLRGNAGDDTLDGGAGDDKLFGDAGNDTFLFNVGNDLMDGGVGDDMAVFAGNQADFDLQNLGSGDWQVTEIASGDVDQLISIETLSFDDGFIFA